MKTTFKLLQKTGKILAFGIFLTLIITGCTNEIFEHGNFSGDNVIVSVETAGRTIRPGSVTAASAFERIEIEFNKGTAVKFLSLVKPNTTGSITVEEGTWSINAIGYLSIEGREYEAARGSSTVTVEKSGVKNVGIELRTGIFNEAPGVFKYSISYPSNVTEAVLDIAPLSDLHGIENTNTGKKVNLKSEANGFFDLLPGYYILNLTAKYDNMMAIWNELVHIYSGQETAANHTITLGDFKGTIQLSGAVQGGELNGEHIVSAVLTAYSDANCLNRIAGFDIPVFTKMGAAPYYYTGSWAISVPSSYAGKDIYFTVDETRNGPAGLKTYIWKETIKVSETQNTGITLDASYVWKLWTDSGNNSEVNFSIAADGVLTVSNTVTNTNTWDDWKQNVHINFPAEDHIKYMYEFEAWTQSGLRKMEVQYIQIPATETYLTKSFDLSATRNTFEIISTVKFTQDTSPLLIFRVGSTKLETVYIKLKRIIPSNEYMPPESTGTYTRFHAQAVTQSEVTNYGVAPGIVFRIDLTGLPSGISGLQIYDTNTDNCFEVYNSNLGYMDNYIFIYPYVDPGKEYTFRLQWQGISMVNLYSEPVTALTGRGEFGFKNSSQLSLVKNGNKIGYNASPVILNFDDKNVAVNGRIRYCVVTGTTWDLPDAEWQFNVNIDAPADIDLIDIAVKHNWYTNLTQIMGKTCFVYSNYYFNYDDADIYPDSDNYYYPSGSFASKGYNSIPFTYPNKIPGALIAETFTEGVRLIVDITKIPKTREGYWYWDFDEEVYVPASGTQSMQFHTSDWTGGRLYFSHGEWTEGWGRFYERDKLEIVYPFVETGKTYTFQVDFGGTGTIGEAVITASSGLGELKGSNWSNVGLLYDNRTTTMSVSQTPAAPVISSSPLITEKYWQWQFNRGINWNDSVWVGVYNKNTPFSSVKFDHTFTPKLTFGVETASLSGQSVNIMQLYNVVYDGFTFESEVGTRSPSFIFPKYDYKVGIGNSWIETAFDANSNMYLGYYNSINSISGYFYASVGSPYYQKSISYQWYINGTLLTNESDSYIYNLSSIAPGIVKSGMNYGLVIVTVDGAQFAKEFAFRVNE
ncbi:MAG: hypothetical protein FWC03_11190 [Treponema sp.]|nr:hypothetical protein [Treponema sp.]